MSTILFVRIESELGPDDLNRRLLERRPQFLAVPGLMQKLYGRDETTGDLCGVYIFDNRESLDAFRESELAKDTPVAYEATAVRREIYEVLYPLYPDRGPTP